MKLFVLKPRSVLPYDSIKKVIIKDLYSDFRYFYIIINLVTLIEIEECKR